MFEYVEGAITTVGSERAAGAYAAAGRLLRGLHDATTGHPLAGEEECVAHGDPGPFNTVFRDGLPVCFIDWDEAHAGARLPDLAYMGWTWCVHSDWGATVQEEARRLRELRDGYGTGAADELVAAIVDAQIAMERNGETRHAQEGRPAEWYDEAQGIVAWARASREYLERHAATFLAALRD
jgi:Ser/Thr protein kinase RdoA (MazF antagonist)